MYWSIINKTIPLLLLAALGQAQQAVLPVEEYRKTWSGANELILTDKSSYDIFVKDNKLKVLRDNHYESIILSESGIINNKESFSYSELVKLVDYEAFSIVNERGREKKVKVTQTAEKLARENAIFHNDVKERQLNFANLEAGSRKVYNVRTEFLDPYLLHSFVFASHMPMLNSTLEVRTDKDINIGFKIFNDPGNAIVFSKTEKKGKYIYTWSLKDVSAYKYEPNNPGFRYSLPHMYIYVKDFPSGETKVDVLEDTDRLYSYYRNFVKDINKDEDAALKKLSIDLTSGLRDDTEKIKKIFYWVKDNVKYIAFENGYEGFIPRESALVFERKFGDCKDMATLITCMAKYAGVPNVNMCWIGTREIPYSYAELSTPAVDNHMIASFGNKGEYLFLDATDRETRFGLPTAFIQGKEAMIGLGDDYKIVTVPTIPADQNMSVETIKLSLEGEKLKGVGSSSFNGYSRSHILMQIGDASNRTRFEMVKSLVLKGSNKFNLNDFSESNLENRDLPYRIDYNFDLADYAVSADKEMYIGMALDKPFEKMMIEADRQFPFEFDFLSGNDITYELELPSGTSPTYIPKNFDIDNELIHASGTYSTTASKVSLRLIVKIKKMLLQKPDFDLWNQSISKLKDNYSETLILTKK